MSLPSKVYRVIGPPGTGKTLATFLARQARIAADKYGASSVVAVSLTRTAAAEIAGRDTPLHEQNIGTLHAIAHRALEGPDLAETAASMRAFAAANPALAANNVNNQEWVTEDDPTMVGKASVMHAAVTNHRARMTERHLWSEDERAYDAAWTDWKAQHGTLDFTDLIEHCLRDHVAPLADPRALFLDEAQDFSALELALAVQWAKRTDTTVVVADSQQALYTWRGSDPDALDGMQVAGQRILDQSYRVPRAVHTAAAAWVAQLPGPEIQWKPRDAEGSVDLAPYALRDTQDVVEAITASLANSTPDSLTNSTPTTEGTTMLLASCRYMLTPIVAALKADGVPFANRWAESEPAWNPLQGAGTRALLALLRPRADAWGAQARMWTWADLLTLTDPMQATALERGAKAAIKAHCIPDEFGTTHATQQAPITTLLTLLGPAAERLLDIDRDLDATLDWWRGALLAKGEAGARYPLAVLRAYGPRALREAPALTIGTVHSTKGSEADHVLLAPELSKEGYYQGWLSGGPSRDAIIRQMYVGATRARESLTILEPGCPEYAPVADVLRDQQRAVA